MRSFPNRGIPQGIRLMLGFLVAAFAASCGGDGIAGSNPATSAAGLWRVANVNGKPLPYTALAAGPDSVIVIGGQLSLASNGTWSGTDSVRYFGTFYEIAGHGDWSQSGSGILLHDVSTGGSGSMTFDGTSIVQSGFAVGQVENLSLTFNRK